MFSDCVSICVCVFRNPTPVEEEDSSNINNDPEVKVRELEFVDLTKGLIVCSICNYKILT